MRLVNFDARAEFSATHPFPPHMTIATCDTRAQIERLDVSNAGELPLRGVLRALEVVQSSDGVLSALKTLPFGR